MCPSSSTVRKATVLTSPFPTLGAITEPTLAILLIEERPASKYATKKDAAKTHKTQNNCKRKMWQIHNTMKVYIAAHKVVLLFYNIVKNCNKVLKRHIR